MNKIVDCYFCDEYFSYGSKRDPGYFSVYGNFLDKSLDQKIKENILEKGLDQKDE